MKARTFVQLLLGIAFVAIAGRAQAQYPEEARQALRMVSADIQAALAKSGVPKDSPIALLPIKGDSTRYVIGILKNAATGAGLTCVEGKEDPFVDEIWKEIEWDERKDDILDAATIAKFGRLKAAKLLMYATIREASGGNGRGYAEIEVHVSSIETKRHLWGSVFARRFYDSQLPVGPVDLDPVVRKVVREAMEKIAPSIKASPKLKDIRSVLIVPLAGDIDKFVSGLVENSLSSTPQSPKQLDVGTLGEARALLRDDPKAADAILYGAIRDLSRKKLNEYPDHTDYEINTSVQLTIQKSPSGEVLWSQTVESSGRDTITLSWWEMTKRYGPFVASKQGYIITPIVVFVGLIVLFVFFRMMRRAR